MIPSIDSRIKTTEAVAIMHDRITMATGSRRVRPSRLKKLSFFHIFYHFFKSFFHIFYHFFSSIAKVHREVVKLNLSGGIKI